MLGFFNRPDMHAVHVPALESPQPDRYLPAAHVSHAWHVLFHDPLSILNCPGYVSGIYRFQ